MKRSVPILFVIFNRPDIAIKAFEKIRSIKPERLYLASDGPRQTVPNEKEIVHKTRSAILDMIDWNCDVKTLFRENNLGCSMGVYTSINWLFENEDFGIIIEDDCIVTDSFYPFMKELLYKYENDERIGMIAGTNPVNKKCTNDSYLFSRYKGCWGWATWKRAWQYMDIDMNWRNVDFNSVLYNSGFAGKDKSKWLSQLEYIDNHYVSAWDWQWYFSLASQNQLCIFPSCNLVTNIGNTIDATHFQFGSVKFDSYELCFPLKHPQYILPNSQFDYFFYKEEYTIIKVLSRIIPFSIKNKIKYLLCRN